MKSMTGFANLRETLVRGDLDVSLRSVNGRFLEARLHIPREYAALESEFKKILGETYQRGTVDVYINRKKNQGSESVQVGVREDLAKQWHSAYLKLAKSLKLRSKPSLEMLIQVPEVFYVEEELGMTAKEKSELLDLFSRLVKTADLERIREGKALQSELLKLLGLFSAQVQTIESFRVQAVQDLEKRFRDRLQKLGLDKAADEQRLAQEIVIQIDRTDIAEEISRLKEHIKMYHDLLQSGVAQGKKLDFYAQELLREINTIGSKSFLSSLTAAVVECKTLIEKIREQVQNVE